MKKSVFVLMVFSCSQIFAQEEEVFKVCGPKKIQLLPVVDSLLGDQDYHFHFKGISIKDVSQITFNGGIVAKSDSDIVIHTLNPSASGDRALYELLVFIKVPPKQVYQKDFTIVHKALPISVAQASKPGKKGKFSYGHVVRP